jgi:hypothetical protein
VGKQTKSSALGSPRAEKVASTNVTVPRQTPKTEFASASELVDELPDSMLIDMLPLLHVRLKKYDETMNQTIKRKLIVAMSKDLDDPEKCTPQLYQAMMRLISEQIPLNEDMISGSRVAEIEAELPFK